MNIKDKIVVVIGSSGGIGREVALLFAQKKARVVLTYNRNKKAGEDILSDCSRYTECILLKLNICDENSITNAIKKIAKRFKRIDVLINAAGIMHQKPFIKNTIREIREEMGINLIGPINMIKESIPYLNKNRAVILNLVSSAGKRPHHANHASYCASKFGLRGFGQALALELPKNIKLYSVNPPPTATKMTHYKGISPIKVAERIIQTTEGRFHKSSRGDIDFKK